ncbi:MAG: lysoplasmalogenase, partial [Flavobacteriaceae bacterium]|nr:lysoplasmalogenase [Flavobacteriaceae bacterium]
CLIGDVFLLDDAYFIAGLASFLIGHLVFTYAFLSLKGFQKKYGIFGILLFIGLVYFFYLKPSLGEITIPVGIYILVIVLMNWQALSLYSNEKNKAFLMISIGAILFLISDSILAFDKFKEPFSLAGILILSTYWTAISMFAYSVISKERQ